RPADAPAEPGTEHPDRPGEVVGRHVGGFVQTAHEATRHPEEARRRLDGEEQQRRRHRGERDAPAERAPWRAQSAHGTLAARARVLVASLGARFRAADVVRVREITGAEAVPGILPPAHAYEKPALGAGCRARSPRARSPGPARP